MSSFRIKFIDISGRLFKIVKGPHIRGIKGSDKVGKRICVQDVVKKYREVKQRRRYYERRGNR